MSSSIITVENLAKVYLVGHEASTEKYNALRDVLGRHARNFVRKSLDMLRGRQIIQGDEIEEFWALRDVSFEIEPGEVVGIIGSNGAGKSTLLKVLSRITEPTKGRVTLHGRVASLLEVGTGFHPELSGRENIFLNGAILGMSRSEIRRKFDEIVAFAEVDRFLDTPVKRYSSGMYVRLAFSVAAHLDPEILVVDEVLAVGDAKFQKKCLGKMKYVSRDEGRTVLFVSHNMAAIKTLCTRAICLERGSLVCDGDPEAVLRRYMHVGDGELFNGIISPNRPRLYGTQNFQFDTLQLIDEFGQSTQVIETGHNLAFSIRFRLNEPVDGLFLELGLNDVNGNQVTQSRHPLHNEVPMSLAAGEYEIQLSSNVILFPGNYSVLLGAHLTSGTTLDWVERALDIEVINAPSDSEYHHPWSVRGYLRPLDTWSALKVLSKISESAIS